GLPQALKSATIARMMTLTPYSIAAIWTVRGLPFASRRPPRHAVGVSTMTAMVSLIVRIPTVPANRPAIRPSAPALKMSYLVFAAITSTMTAIVSPTAPTRPVLPIRPARSSLPYECVYRALHGSKSGERGEVGRKGHIGRGGREDKGFIIHVDPQIEAVSLVNPIARRNLGADVGSADRYGLSILDFRDR